MPIIQNYTEDGEGFPIGDSNDIPFSCSSLDLTSCILVFSLSLSLPDGGVFAIQKRSDSGGITITSPTTALIHMLDVDTINLAPGPYFMSVVAVLVAGHHTLTTGVFNLVDHVFR